MNHCKYLSLILILCNDCIAVASRHKNQHVCHAKKVNLNDNRIHQILNMLAKFTLFGSFTNKFWSVILNENESSGVSFLLLTQNTCSFHDDVVYLVNKYFIWYCLENLLVICHSVFMLRINFPF